MNNCNFWIIYFYSMTPVIFLFVLFVICAIKQVIEDKKEKRYKEEYRSWRKENGNKWWLESYKVWKYIYKRK